MSANALIATWLQDSTITALVGNRKALGRLKQGTTYPALVYQVVSFTPEPHVDYQNRPQLAQLRVQLNPLASSIGGVELIANAIRELMDFKHQVLVAGKRVVSSRFDQAGPTEPDPDDPSIYTQAIDYIVWYYE